MLIALYCFAAGVLPTFTLLDVGRDHLTSQNQPDEGLSVWEKLDILYSTNSSSDRSTGCSIGQSLSAISARNPTLPMSSLFRVYELECPQMRCHFTEIFRPGFLELDQN